VRVLELAAAGVTSPLHFQLIEHGVFETKPQFLAGVPDGLIVSFYFVFKLDQWRAAAVGNRVYSQHTRDPSV
jgi:uncharacterized membrane protein YGL010W